MNRYVLVLLFLTRFAFAQTDPQLVLNTSGHQAMINDLVVTSDGKTIISAGDDKVIRIWKAQTGQLINEIRGQQSKGNEGKIYALALSPDNHWLATAGCMKNGARPTTITTELSRSMRSTCTLPTASSRFAH